MNQGYVKVYRKLDNSGIFSHDLKVAGFFTWLLIHVNWKAEKWQGEWIHPGSIITSIPKLSAMIYETPKVTRRLISILEDEGILIREVRANKWSKLTVCNWASYQELPCLKGRQRDIRRADRGIYEGNPIKELIIKNNYKKENLIKEKSFSEGNKRLLEFGEEDQKLITEAAERIRKLHPRVSIHPQHAECAIINAIIGEVDKGHPLSQSIECVEKRTIVYAQYTSTWPSKEKRYIATAVKWYSSGAFLEDPETWLKGDPADRFEIRDGILYENGRKSNFTGVYDGYKFKNGEFTGYGLTY